MRYRSDGSGNMSRWRIMVIGTMAVILLLGLLGIVYLMGSLMDNAEPKEETLGSIEGRFAPTMTLLHNGREYDYFENYFTNILLMGVDKESIDDQGGYRSGGQADFLMLVSIDRRNRTITPIHIDRDTVTDVKVYSPFGHAAGVNPMQICLAHSFGASNQVNCENTIWAVQKLLQGISIDHYLVLDMTGIAMLNDALGGVTVTLKDDFSHLDPQMTIGTTLRLCGKQAEYFVRGRHEVGDNSNLQRMSRQREFLEKMLDLLTEKISQSAMFVSDLFAELDDHLYTSMDSTWLTNQTYVMDHYQRREIIDLEGQHRIGEDGFMEFHPYEDKLKKLLIDIFMEESEVGTL